MSVVVWEWWSSEVEDWLPHNAGVSRTLERAHHKNLTRVVLADADPTLHSHHVNLLTLTQTYDSADGVTVQCAVRRRLYEASSPAGRGICWEWAPDGDYQPLPMEFQCYVEQAWSSGMESAGSNGWWCSLRGGRAGRGGGRGGGRGAGGALRRGPAPPHPRPAHNDVREPRPRIPQQHTGSSVHSVQSTQSAHSARSAQSAHSATPALPPQAIGRGGARSASPRDRKPGLARQILHNLNIFSNNNKSPPLTDRSWELDQHQRERERERETDRERERDSDTHRRHSVDTVSTYLSHESKDSLQASVGELVNTSTGSDDVFITETAPEECSSAPPPPPLPALQLSPAAAPQWGALCPECLLPLTPPHSPPRPAPRDLPAPAVALPCHHLLHLHCLNDHLDRLTDAGEEMVVECLVCGARFAAPPPAPGHCPSPGPAPCPAPGPAPCPAPRRGTQPPGTMGWAVHHSPLPTHPGTNTIVVTYNFQSGRQTSNHPCPGEPYYAVGFPKYTVLPDTALGRQVLGALRQAWSVGALFSVCVSRRTGREHVVWWSTAPPPRAPEDYAPLHLHHAQRALGAALARLTALCRD